MSIFDIMAAPFAECIVLVAIHTYLGIHVLRRRVIFVDLALAQTAALGTTIGFLFGIMPETPAALIFSILFTFIGAAVFALTRIRGDRVPQEAVIGLFYAIMAAAAVLVVQKTHGAEHMDDILVGNILWVKWADVGWAALAYGFIGVIHYIFRRQFLLISENPDEAYQRGMNVRMWDFLFYLTFGLVISFSVRVAGVLLVFVFLVAPAIMAFIVTDRLKPQLLIGWAMGITVTILGLLISYYVDLPSGPSVVSFYGIVLVLGALTIYVVRAKPKANALMRLGVGVALTVAVFASVFGFGKWLSSTSLAKSDKFTLVEKELSANEEVSKNAATNHIDAGVRKMNSWLTGAVSDDFLKVYSNLEDHGAKLEAIRGLIEENPSQGKAMIVYFLKEELPPLFFRSEAAELLIAQNGSDYGYNPDVASDENKKSLIQMKKELVMKRKN